MLYIFKRQILWFIFFASQTAFVFSAPLFNVNPDSSGITIRTVQQGHTYPIAGIKVNSPGYHLTQAGNECELFSNGYCLFSVSNTAPKHLSIINTSAVINITLCLNGKGPVSCQMYKVTIKDKKYTLGGSISGLTRSGLVLLNNGADNLNVSAGATSFKFTTPISEGSSYRVTVGRQPVGEVCTVSNGSGINVSENITSIRVVCSSDTYSIGGTVSKLLRPGLVLQNNGADDLAINQNGSFTFTQKVAFGSSYNVTISHQPTGQVCSVLNGSGSFVRSNVRDISVVCSRDRYTIGGTLSGLTRPGLVLRNNGADDLLIQANATTFQFSQPVPLGGSYNVTIAKQPKGETCSIQYYSGTNVQDNVTDIEVTCALKEYSIGGTVSGLIGRGLVLRNNGSDDFPIFTNGSYAFPQKVPNGGSYDVTIQSQPSESYCSVSNASGSDITGPVSNVDINCSPISVPIKGTITGLNQSGLIIQNNGGDTQIIAAGTTSFRFTPVPAATSYNVTITEQPLGQTCTITPPASGLATPPQVTINIICTVSHAYVNENGRAGGLGLYLCDLDSSGNLTNCNFTPNSGAPNWDPGDIAFATFSGTESAYVTDWTTQGVYKCDVTNGALSSCIPQPPTFGDGNPVSIAIQTIKGTQYAYIVADLTVYKCIFIPNGTMTGCTQTLPNPTPITNPEGITIQAFNGTYYAYLPNAAGNNVPNYVYRCKINATGDLEQCNPTPSGPSSFQNGASPGGVAFTNINSILYAYVTTNSPTPNSNNTVLRYNLNNDGTFQPSPLTAYAPSVQDIYGPIQFATINNTLYAYIVDTEAVSQGSSPLVRCVVNSDGTLTTCIPNPIDNPSLLVSPSNIRFK